MEMNTRTLARARFARTSAEGGGGGAPAGGDNGGAQGAGSGSDTDSKNQKPDAPTEAVDENGVKLGFPDKTPVDSMTDAQQAAYWRHESKKANKRVPKNLDELQTAAQRWAEHQRSQLPEEQRKAAEREEQIRKETEAAVRKEAAEDSAEALLRVTLSTRGRTDAEVDEILEPLSMTKFITQDGKPDTARVIAYVDKLAPGRSGGGGQGMGQGRFDQQPSNRAEAGKLEAQKRGYGGLKKEAQKQ